MSAVREKNESRSVYKPIRWKTEQIASFPREKQARTQHINEGCGSLSISLLWLVSSYSNILSLWHCLTWASEKWGCWKFWSPMEAGDCDASEILDFLNQLLAYSSIWWVGNIRGYALPRGWWECFWIKGRRFCGNFPTLYAVESHKI